MRLLYLDVPHLPLRLEAAARPPLPELVVLGGQPWDPGTVLDESPAAKQLGVHPGQPLGSAHNLVPDALFLPADLPAYRAAMERALDALAAFTPSVEGEADPRHAAFGQVFLGIEGLARLWGDETTLARRVCAALAPILPGRPRIGIGNTRFGAQVAAVIGARRSRERGRGRAPGSDPRASAGRASEARASDLRASEARASDGLASDVPPVDDAGGPADTVPVEAIPVGGPETEAAWLAPMPIALLSGDRETRDRLRLFGLARIGEFAALPRSAIVARFGERGGELHDLARGLDGRALRPRRPIERLRAEAELDPPVDDVEPLRFVLHHLCGSLCDQLSARGSGAGRVTLTLTLERREARRYEQALPEPSAVADLLERLLMARLEAAPPDAPVERLALELHGTAPAAGQQLGLFTPQLAREARLDWQLTALAIRYGPERVLRARLADPEATLAEERFAWLRATGDDHDGAAIGR